MPIIPDNDPNEAYDVVPMKEHERGPRGDWHTVTCNGIPVFHFAPANIWDAERYCCDPRYRLSLETKYIHG
jgi:hypothetical protein